MKLQIKSNFFKLSLIYLVFLTFSVLIIYNIGITMPDDGWRHLAMALYPDQIQSWGRVYPHTLYGEFDPWFMWHNLLSFIHKFVQVSYIHIIINSIIYSLLSFWYYLVLSRYTEVPTLFIFSLAFGLPMLTMRYFFLRPDALSGLFVLYFLILKNNILLFITTFLYTPFYYVFWFHLGYMSYIQVILKNYKKLIILIASLFFGFIFYLYIDLEGFLQITSNVLNNDALLEKFSVGESKPYFFPLEIKNQLGSSIFLFLLISFSLIIYYIFKPKDYLVRIFILFLPLMFVQHRFLNLFQPIIYVFFIHIFYLSYKIVAEEGIPSLINLIKNFIIKRSYFGKISNKYFKYIFLSFVILFFLLQYNKVQKGSSHLEKEFSEMTFLTDDEFKNKKILFSSMSTTGFMSLFINPTASYIPGCSLGWVNYDKKNKKTYFDLLTNNEKINMNNFFEFLRLNKPDYLIINNLSTTNLTFDSNKIEQNGYKFYKIINSKLIFRNSL